MNENQALETDSSVGRQETSPQCSDEIIKETKTEITVTSTRPLITTASPEPIE